MVGDIVTLAKTYRDQGADELVFYDITASVEQRSVDRRWIRNIAAVLDIPFCVAGGIKSLKDAEEILNAGADKVSINTPAIEEPQLIDRLANAFGAQSIVVGVDSRSDPSGQFYTYKYTGEPRYTQSGGKRTIDWVKEVQDRGAGEIVLNCMDADGTRVGYDCQQLALVRDVCHVPLIASGGAGALSHFVDVFKQAAVDGALAASVFHKAVFTVSELKWVLSQAGISVRL